MKKNVHKQQPKANLSTHNIYSYLHGNYKVGPMDGTETRMDQGFVEVQHQALFASVVGVMRSQQLDSTLIVRVLRVRLARKATVGGLGWQETTTHQSQTVHKGFAGLVDIRVVLALITVLVVTLRELTPSVHMKLGFGPGRVDLASPVNSLRRPRSGGLATGIRLCNEIRNVALRQLCRLRDQRRSRYTGGS